MIRIDDCLLITRGDVKIRWRTFGRELEMDEPEAGAVDDEDDNSRTDLFPDGTSASLRHHG
jgi:hypothetical protein